MSPMTPTPVPLARFLPTTRVALLLLLVGDGVLIFAHIIHVWTPWLHPTLFSVERDGGFPELYQYMKLLLLSAGFLMVAVRTRGWVLVGWSAFFTLLMLDDALQIHERSGDVLGPMLGITPVAGLRTDDYGEIAYATLLGLFALLFVAATFRRGSTLSRQISADILCLLVALGIFAVFFDTLHTMAYFRAPAISPPLALLEDGGEMIVVSVLTGYLVGLANNSGHPPMDVWGNVRARLHWSSGARQTISGS